MQLLGELLASERTLRFCNSPWLHVKLHYPNAAATVADGYRFIQEALA